jgi:hypothetical protein
MVYRQGLSHQLLHGSEVSHIGHKRQGVLTALRCHASKGRFIAIDQNGYPTGVQDFDGCCGTYPRGGTCDQNNPPLQRQNACVLARCLRHSRP